MTESQEQHWHVKNPLVVGHVIVAPGFSVGHSSTLCHLQAHCSPIAEFKNKFSFCRQKECSSPNSAGVKEVNRKKVKQKWWTLQVQCLLFFHLPLFHKFQTMRQQQQQGETVHPCCWILSLSHRTLFYLSSEARSSCVLTCNLMAWISHESEPPQHL